MDEWSVATHRWTPTWCFPCRGTPAPRTRFPASSGRSWAWGGTFCTFSCGWGPPAARWASGHRPSPTAGPRSVCWRTLGAHWSSGWRCSAGSSSTERLQPGPSQWPALFTVSGSSFLEHCVFGLWLQWEKLFPVFPRSCLNSEGGFKFFLNLTETPTTRRRLSTALRARNFHFFVC